MTNEEYYQVLEDYINELKQLREQAKELGIMMAGENLTLDELFFISALNRRVRFIDGFIQLLKSRNLTCAGVLVRTQLDNLMRVYAAFIANDKGDFVNEYLAGTPIRNLVDDENKKMTDSHLKKRISKIFPEFEKVYNKASGYVHLSEVALHETFWSDKDGGLNFTIGIEPREELNVVLIESVQVFCYFTEIEFALYTQVSESKKNLDEMLKENQSDKFEN